MGWTLDICKGDGGSDSSFLGFIMSNVSSVAFGFREEQKLEVV